MRLNHCYSYVYFGARADAVIGYILGGCSCLFINIGLFVIKNDIFLNVHCMVRLFNIIENLKTFLKGIILK